MHSSYVQLISILQQFYSFSSSQQLSITEDCHTSFTMMGHPSGSLQSQHSPRNTWQQSRGQQANAIRYEMRKLCHQCQGRVLWTPLNHCGISKQQGIL